MLQLDPNDGSVLRTVFTRGYPHALAANSTSIWSASGNAGLRLGLLYEYELSEGLYLSHLDTHALYPSGLAYAAPDMWCADIGDATIHRLTLRARREQK